MVVELILTTLLTQAVSHYAQKGFSWFDSQTEDLAEKAAAGDDGARASVQRMLAEKLKATDSTPHDTSDVREEGAASAEQIVADVVFGVPTRDEQGLSKRMLRFGQTLDGIFGAVHEFPGSMAAVPGWFHCQHCIAVLDARSGQFDWDPKSWLMGPSGAKPYFQFEDVNSADVITGIHGASGRPRVTIVECGEAEGVSQVLKRLRPQLASFDNEGKDWSSAAIHEAAGVKPDMVRPFLKLYVDRVELGAPASAVRLHDENISDYMNRLKDLAPIEVGLTEPSVLTLMKADVVRQVLGRAEEDLKWEDF